jgi:uncharacterized protein (DUF58 family)
MRLTRRGWAVAGIGVGAEAMALAFGARALNAIVAPAVVAFVVGFVVLARRDTPTLTRQRPGPGFPGERRTVRLRVTADGPAAIRDELPEGLRAIGTPTVSRASDGEASYEIRYRSRGEHRIGPARVVERDPLGVLARETTVAELTPVLVYPEVVAIDPTRAFAALVETTGSPERQAFDRLREYVPGDALRDVDWKASAKRADDELVVTEYADEDATGITLVAAGEPGHGDAMAGAAASIAAYLEANDLSVTLVTPTAELPEGRGDEHRDELLELLARVPAGRTAEHPDADVHVFADADGVTVTVRGSTVSFDALRDDGAGTGLVAPDAGGAPGEDRERSDGTSPDPGSEVFA